MHTRLQQPVILPFYNLHSHAPPAHNTKAECLVMSAAAVAAAITGSAENKAAVAATHGAVSGLVWLLGSQNPSLQTIAAAALGDLCAGNTANKEAVAAIPGAIPGLVSLLGEGNASIIVQVSLLVLLLLLLLPCFCVCLRICRRMMRNRANVTRQEVEGRPQKVSRLPMHVTSSHQWPELCTSNSVDPLLWAMRQLAAAVTSRLCHQPPLSPATTATVTSRHSHQPPLSPAASVTSRHRPCMQLHPATAQYSQISPALVF
jgi:hypothetical protein